MDGTLSAEDRWSLADLVADYAHAVDARDFEALRSVFVPDAVLDTGRAVRTGIAEILEAMERLRRYEATVHHVAAPRVRPDGADRAVGITSCHAHHLTVDGERRTDRVMHIRYHDRFVCTVAGWRIAHRRLVVPWVDDRPVS